MTDELRGPALRPHGYAPAKCWLIFPDDGGAPVLWTEPCPFPVDDGTVVEYCARSLAARVQALEEALRGKVKPLEWEPAPSCIDAEWICDFGLYVINECILFIGHEETGIPFDGLAEAKAAAQADYERRILSSLTHTTEG